MRRIAVSGKMASGKTTLVNRLIENEPRFVKVSFAEPIYKLAREYFGMVDKDRNLLIHIGESFRAKDSEVWIRAFLRRVDALEAQGNFVIVDDLRMLSEHTALRKAGFKLVRLNVSRPEQVRRLQDKYPTTFETHMDKSMHETECALDHVYDWDVYGSENADIESIYSVATKLS